MAGATPDVRALGRSHRKPLPRPPTGIRHHRVKVTGTDRPVPQAAGPAVLAIPGRALLSRHGRDDAPGRFYGAGCYSGLGERQNSHQR
ncbi:hypothetical protein GCM10010448_59370 [Streptomyces glomeratus]|uniref:Uncharacterized protein n=1 Tax=Streptomyces glomeratus TaxID=284452 RepID=A0ABP6LZM2_9ACTN